MREGRLNLESRKSGFPVGWRWKVSKVVAAAVVLGVVVLGGLMWQFERPPVDLAKLGRIEIGMSQAQVEVILGAPRTIHGQQWTYARSLSWPLVQVQFDASGKLDRINYDR
jgi:hypothetical protein